MDPERRYRELADQLTIALLALDGVNAVSADADGLNVYIRPGDPGVALAVEELVRQHDAKVPIHYLSSGEFRAL